MFDTSDETRNAFLAAMAKAAPPARAAEGNAGHHLRRRRDPEPLSCVETCTSAEAHEAQSAAEYSQALDAELEGLLTADPMQRRRPLPEIPLDS